MTNSSDNNASSSSKNLQENHYSPPEKEDLLRDAMEYRDYFEDEEEFQEALALWPTCPVCGRRRITQCPICKTIGTLFPLADADYWVEETTSAASHSHATGNCAHHCNHSDSSSCSHDSSPTDSEAEHLPKLPSMDILGQYMPSSSLKEKGKDENGSDQSEVKAKETEDSTPFPNTLDGQIMPGVRNWRTNDYSIVEVTANQTIISVENEEYQKPKEIPDRNALDSQEGRLKLVNCYVCSESFSPKFPPQCEWCNHIFEDKDEQTSIKSNSIENCLCKSDNNNEYKQESNSENEWNDLHRIQTIQQEDELNPKILFVLIAMGLLFLVALLYFLLIFN